MRPFVGGIRKMLNRFGVALTRSGTLKGLVADRRELERMKSFHGFLSALTPHAVTSALRLIPTSRGENFQDIFAMLVLPERQNGFFVEFGATDGVQGSNSYLMEKTFGWSGILAEPARCWHAALQRNRSVTISQKCVWREGGVRLPFRETRDAGFSTLDALTAQDRHASRRVPAGIYEVDTVSLLELLSEHSAPKVIDYMSIDTEGSEFDILESFDFQSYRPLVLTIEHNYRPDRDKMVALMHGHGYLRAPIGVSAYDDWFVCKTLADRLQDIFSQDALQDTHLEKSDIVGPALAREA